MIQVLCAPPLVFPWAFRARRGAAFAAHRAHFFGHARRVGAGAGVDDVDRQAGFLDLLGRAAATLGSAACAGALNLNFFPSVNCFTLLSRLLGHSDDRPVSSRATSPAMLFTYRAFAVCGRRNPIIDRGSQSAISDASYCSFSTVNAAW
jgi:hypothetical protein